MRMRLKTRMPKSLINDWCEVFPQSTVSTIPQLLVVDNCVSEQKCLILELYNFKSKYN